MFRHAESLKHDDGCIEVGYVEGVSLIANAKRGEKEAGNLIQWKDIERLREQTAKEIW